MLQLGLLIVWAGLLFGGFIFGKDNDDHTRRMPIWTRMGSSLVLVIAAWSSGIPVWFAVGMTLGLIGDLFMAELLIKKNHLYGGIAAFGLGHVAYIIGMAGLGAPVWTTMLIWWGIGFVGWVVVVWLSKTPLPERLAALPYTLLLASTTGFAFSIPNLGWVALGAALFLLSDLILAAQLFRGVRFRWISDVVWFTYGPGQMLIIYGVMLAMGKFNV